MITDPEGTAPEVARDASRRATALTVAVMCLLLATRVSAVLAAAEPGQVPFTMALFVLPLLYAVPETRPLLARHRWLILAVQAVLTWVPFAVFGRAWQIGIGGLLAGLVLLLVRGRLSWLLAGALLAAEVTARAGLTVQLFPGVPAWAGVVVTVAFYVDDALVFFGMVRMAQIVGEVENARGLAAGLAIAHERLQAARSLQAAVGERLAGIAAQAAAARQALGHDAARAGAQIAAAGMAAREAIAQARAAAAGERSWPRRGLGTPSPGTAVIGARLAWAVLVTVLLMFAATAVAGTISYHASAGLTALAVGGIILIAALQLRHSRPAPDGRRPAAWPLTLGLQAAAVYAFSFGSTDFSGGNLAPFLAGSVLLLARSRWRWAGYAAVVASSAVLYAALPLRELAPPVVPRPLYALYAVPSVAGPGLVVYGLSRLAALAAQLEALQAELARVAVVRERLRIARDVHDLLGLGLSAIALKADLAGRLIGHDDDRAAAELGELGRICAAARADARQVTGGGRRLSLTAELAAARQILTSAGVHVQADIPAGPLPAVADDVLATVLREAVTNILRHATAITCTVETTVGDGAVRLRICNDGVPGRAGASGRPGSGLANLTTRVHAVGGHLATRQTEGRFDLLAEVPLATPPG